MICKVCKMFETGNDADICDICEIEIEVGQYDAREPYRPIIDDEE